MDLNTLLDQTEGRCKQYLARNTPVGLCRTCCYPSYCVNQNKAVVTLYILQHYSAIIKVTCPEISAQWGASTQQLIRDARQIVPSTLWNHAALTKLLLSAEALAVYSPFFLVKNMARLRTMLRPIMASSLPREQLKQRQRLQILSLQIEALFVLPPDLLDYIREEFRQECLQQEPLVAW